MTKAYEWGNCYFWKASCPYQNRADAYLQHRTTTTETLHSFGWSLPARGQLLHGSLRKVPGMAATQPYNLPPHGGRPQSRHTAALSIWARCPPGPTLCAIKQIIWKHKPSNELSVQKLMGHTLRQRISTFWKVPPSTAQTRWHRTVPWYYQTL